MQIYVVTASINPLENLCTLANCSLSSDEIKVLVIDEGDEGIRKINKKLLSSLPPRVLWTKGKGSMVQACIWAILPKISQAYS